MSKGSKLSNMSNLQRFTIVSENPCVAGSIPARATQQSPQKQQLTKHLQNSHKVKSSKLITTIYYLSLLYVSILIPFSLPIITTPFYYPNQIKFNLE